jgi:hypothetical protein
MGHALMENRNGMGVDSRMTLTSGTAEWDAAFDLPGTNRVTIGADKGYDVPVFVDGLREGLATPHVARKDKGTAVDERTTRHEDYRVSQRIRKQAKEIFGWLKTVSCLRKTQHRGLDLVG